MTPPWMAGLAHTHEGSHRVGNGLIDIALVGDAPGEDYRRRNAVAFGETEDVVPRLSRMHVVDAQIERRADLEFRQCAGCGNPAGGVHQRSDRAAMNDSGLRVADDLFAVRQAQGESAAVGMLDTQAQNLAVPQD